MALLTHIHVPIKGMTGLEKAASVGKKIFHPLNIQAVADAKMRLIFIFFLLVNFKRNMPFFKSILLLLHVCSHIYLLLDIDTSIIFLQITSHDLYYFLCLVRIPTRQDPLPRIHTRCIRADKLRTSWWAKSLAEGDWFLGDYIPITYVLTVNKQQEKIKKSYSKQEWWLRGHLATGIKIKKALNKLTKSQQTLNCIIYIYLLLNCADMFPATKR